MINTEADKMRKCAQCQVLGLKSKVYPWRKTGDFGYLSSDILAFEQKDVFWDEDGIPHSHVMYECDKAHQWRGECESCAWGKEQVAPAAVLVPPTPTVVPAPTPPVAPKPPVAPVRDKSNDLVLTPPGVRK